MCHAGGKGGRGKAEILRPSRIIPTKWVILAAVGNACTERSRDKGAPDNIDDKCDGQRIKRNILGWSLK